MKKDKGITLIALVVTIVVLLILASITVGTLMGENGTIKKAKEAKREHEISQEREIVELSAVQAADKDKFGNIQIGNLNQTLTENIGNGKYELGEDDTKFIIKFTNSASKTEHYVWKDIPILTNNNVQIACNPNTWTNQNVTATVTTEIKGFILQTSKDGKNWTTKKQQTYSENGTIYVRIINENGDYSKSLTGNITNIDKTKPIIKTVTSTTNSIKLTATDEASGIVGYAATTNNTAPTNFIKCTSTKALNVRIENLKQNTTYYVWVKDQAGNISVSKTMKTEKVPDLTLANANFTYEPNIWTNGNVIATAKPSISGYTIETSKDNKTWTATNKQTRSENGAVYVRLKDSTGQVGGVATGNVTNIDKIAPSATIALSGAGTVTVNPKVGATVQHQDEASGVNIMKYVFNKNSTQIGTDEENYSGTFYSNGEKIEIALPSEEGSDGGYYIHVLTVDNAGNKTESISKTINYTVSKHTHVNSCYSAQNTGHRHTSSCPHHRDRHPYSCRSTLLS